MKEIIVKTQKEFNALPKAFDEDTCVYLQNVEETIVVTFNRENSSVVAWGNSSVVARENSRVEAWENSRVEARENSSVVAWGNSRVEAWGNSSVVARGNSSVVARGNSSVVAWGNSSVVAWGNSRVVARENSSVEAWGNSSVVAWENSSVVARENSSVRLFWETVQVVLHGFSIAILPVTLKLKIAIKKESKYVIIQKTKDLGWFERNGIKKSAKIILYKRVSEEFETQEDTENETKWNVGDMVECKNWNPGESECGAGKFHACSRPYFCDEFRDKRGDKYIAIEVASKDLYEWEDSPQYPYKIGFRKGRVLYECDRFGKKIG
jgi:hypothetical protein